MASLPEGEALLDQVTSHSDQVLPDTSARPGQDRITRQVQSLDHELEALRMLAQDSCSNLEQYASLWREFQEKARLLSSWMEGVKKDVGNIEGESENLKEKEEKLQKVKVTIHFFLTYMLFWQDIDPHFPLSIPILNGYLAGFIPSNGPPCLRLSELKLG